MKAWLLAAAIAAAALLALFRLADPHRLAGAWPLGIAAEEVDAYAAAFAFGADSAGGRVEQYLIASAPGACPMEDHGAGWEPHWFEAGDYADSVQVRRLRTAEGGFVIRFRRNAPFRRQRHIALIPADAESIRAKYLEAVARELGLVTPEATFVRLTACGADQGLYLKEERIDADFLEKHGLAGAALAEQGHDAARPDHLFPGFDGDSAATVMLSAVLARAYQDAEAGSRSALPRVVDAQGAAAALLMAWLEHGEEAFRHPHQLAYSWTHGRMVPLYRRARGEGLGQGHPATVMSDMLTLALRDEAMKALIRERWMQLGERAWHLRERFHAIDRAWLPILARGRSLSLARAHAQRMQEELVGAARLAADPLAGLAAEPVRHAGAASLQAGMRADRFWADAADTAALAGILRRTKAQLRGDTLVFPRGRYPIATDLTVPYGRPVAIEAGARFEVAQGVSVMVQGALDVRGTARNPVFIRPASEAAPYGSFIVVGDGATPVRISGLQMSGGQEARINGVYASGMLAIHGAGRTELRDCIISGSEGEDLVNIKGGEVLLEGCTFSDALADLVDLDYCTGLVRRCRFLSGRKDSNGDGLDVSGARILVQDCSFERMMDKGISVGEASQLLVMGSRFIGNRTGLVAKDLSVAYAEGCAFTGNEVAFSAYRKKPIYGGARIVRYASNVLEGNGRESESDALSTVVGEEAPDAKVRGMFGLP